MTIYVVRRKFNSCQDSMHIAVLQTLEEALSPKIIFDGNYGTTINQLNVKNYHYLLPLVDPEICQNTKKCKRQKVKFQKKQQN